MQRLRITPACAGNSHCAARSPPYATDHPRVCGEQPTMRVAMSMSIGSPPRVRGTVPCALAHDQAMRITPACAGNSRCDRLIANAHQDHPRVCGEQVKIMQTFESLFGSPPRVRGTASSKRRDHLQRRITPACAGNSFYRDRGDWRDGITPACAGNRLYGALRPLATTDHPRVCGEQRDSQIGEWMRSGSPPRVRGTACADRARKTL